MSLSSRILYCFSIITLITTFGFLIYISYLLLWPIKIIDFDPSPLTVVDKSLRNGDQLEYIVKYCRYVDHPMEISRSLVDTIVYSLIPYITQDPPGCYTKHILTTMIPEKLPSGKYHLHLNYHIKVNPLRDINIIRETEQFEVINKDF